LHDQGALGLSAPFILRDAARYADRSRK